MRNEKGFTIIEMLIAMTILSFIALALYQNTTQSFRLRGELEIEGDFYNSIRVGLDVLGRDVIHIYSPQAAALPGDMGKAYVPPAGQVGAGAEMPTGNPTQFWGAPLNKDGVRSSRFQGEGDKISFLINSHMRLYRETKETDFSKISYGIEEDRTKKLLPNPNQEKKHDSKVSVRYEDPNAFLLDDNKSETKMRYVVLQNLKSVEFEYLDGEKDTYFKRWDTTSIDHKDKFPALIKITVEVYYNNSENVFKISQLYRPELAI